MSKIAPGSDVRRTCLVTGGTSGLGEAIATNLAARGHRVLTSARTKESGKAAVARIKQRIPEATVDAVIADLSILDDVNGLSDQILARCDQLDILVLNAGVAFSHRHLTPDGFEIDFATNHLSPFLLTQRLRGLLQTSAPSRIVCISSSNHRHVKNIDLAALPTGENFHHIRTYSATKLLNVMFTIELARQMVGTNVTANVADPGFVRTQLGRNAPPAFGLFLKLIRPFQLSPDKAAATPVHLATQPELGNVTGQYFSKCQVVAPSLIATDPIATGELWDLSCRLIDDPRPP